MTSIFSIYLAGFAMLAVGRCQPAPDKVAKGPELERLIQDLIAEDGKVAREAQEQLKNMGPQVVPVLFDRLVTSGWDLKPRLLEVLAETGRDYARLKLLHGTRDEKTFAALIYELGRPGQKDQYSYSSPEFKAMVEVLLDALKGKDKELRAAAGLALVHDDEDTLFFEHLHEIVPALISSFDTELFIARHTGEDPAVLVLCGIAYNLDGLIGDRPVYSDAQAALFRRALTGGAPDRDSPQSWQNFMRRFLTVNRQDIESMRTYWAEWWTNHRHLSAIEIGTLMIQRDIDLFQKTDPSGRPYDPVVVASMLSQWTGEYMPRAEVVEWWEKNKERYRGPIGLANGREPGD